MKLSYDEAMVRLERLAQVEQAPTLNPRCRGFALTHGAPTPRCALLLHGYTNCPQQFRAFAAQLHARGYNVYVPRLPRHGLADRLNHEQAQLTTGELRASLDEALAIVGALGSEISVIGISAGAVLAAQAAQTRPEVAQAVIIAPVFGTPGLPDWSVPALALLARLLPNLFRWWNREARERGPGPKHAYPRYSTRALAAVVGLGLAVVRSARRYPPRARDIVVITNAADPAVTNGPIDALLAAWRAQGAVPRSHRFAAQRALLHDIIDPEQPKQQIAYVYPILLDLIENRPVL